MPIFEYSKDAATLIKLAALAEKHGMTLPELAAAHITEAKMKMTFGQRVERLEPVDFYMDEVKPRGI